MTMSRDLATVEAEIASVKEALANVKGQPTEVYARIVGYYRSVRNWNKGKREEYNHRKMFRYENADSTYALGSADSGCCGPAQTAPVNFAVTETAPAAGKAVRYELFARASCPNCPPVKAYIKELPMEGTVIDADSEEGFARASALGVFAAPTVIFYDNTGAEVFRAHTVRDMQEIFDSEAIPV